MPAYPKSAMTSWMSGRSLAGFVDAVGLGHGVLLGGRFVEGLGGCLSDCDVAVALDGNRLAGRAPRPGAEETACLTATSPWRWMATA
jgi:hypothetical protein